jgi:glycosyltransferase involved in cell wall biosynthesis
VRLGIVLPRYVAHTNISAGAERLGVELAHRLAARGHNVEVVTTCTLDLHEPRNELPSGVSSDGPVCVRRFEIDLRRWERSRHDALTHCWNQGRTYTLTHEDAWLEALPHVPRLYDYVERHQAEYDTLLFLPYLAATTLYGIVLCANRAVLMPALHDEPLARMQLVRAVMTTVRRVLFMTEAEHTLATRDLNLHLRDSRVVGVGVDDMPESVSAQRFRQRFDIQGRIVLYSGRVEAAKNVHVLLTYIDEFSRQYPQHADVTFVLQGSVGMYIAPRKNVRVVPPQPFESYRDAYAAADVLCQPSQYEAFSIVLMEGWLAGAAALVHANCEVTRSHVMACNGGLWFGDSVEFGAALDWLLTHPQERAMMGLTGRQYVLDRYSWQAVLPRVEAALSW